MGIFSTLRTGYAKLVTTSASGYTSMLEKVTGKKYGRITSSQFLKSKTGSRLATGASVTALALGATLPATKAGRVVVARGASTIGKQVVKSPVKSFVGAAVIAGGGARLIPKTFKTIKKSTSSAVPVLLGEKKLTPEKAVDIGTMAGAILGVTALGTGAGLVAKKVLEKTKDKVVEKAITPSIAETPKMPIQPEKQLITEKPVGVAGTPTTPQTTKISTKKRKYKRRTAKKSPSVRQSVKIQINNRPVGLKIQNKRYINKELLVNAC